LLKKEKQREKLLLEKKRKAEMPKKALSSYIYYSNALRPDILRENPQLKITEISKIIGEKWKQITPEEKQKFDQMATQDKQRSLREREVYVSKHPKKPATGYALFVKNNASALREQHKGLKQSEIFKLLSTKWKELPIRDKTSYLKSV